MIPCISVKVDSLHGGVSKIVTKINKFSQNGLNANPVPDSKSNKICSLLLDVLDHQDLENSTPISKTQPIIPLKHQKRLHQQKKLHLGENDQYDSEDAYYFYIPSGSFYDDASESVSMGSNTSLCSEQKHIKGILRRKARDEKLRKKLEENFKNVRFNQLVYFSDGSVCSDSGDSEKFVDGSDSSVSVEESTSKNSRKSGRRKQVKTVPVDLKDPKETLLEFGFNNDFLESIGQTIRLADKEDEVIDAFQLYLEECARKKRVKKYKKSKKSINLKNRIKQYAQRRAQAAVE